MNEPRERDETWTDELPLFGACVVFRDARILPYCLSKLRDLDRAKRPGVKFKARTSKAIEVDTKERSVKSVITAETLDHDGEIVLSGGLDFAAFRKNPCVLLEHGNRSAACNVGIG